MKVLKSDLTGGNLSKMVDILNNEATEAGELINSLDKLSCVLQTKDAATGEIFNKVRSQIENYKTVLQTRKSTAERLASAITSGVSTMTSFMGEYDVINDGQKDTITTNLNRAQANFNAATANAKKELKSLDLKGWWYQRGLVNRYEAEIDEIQKYLDKINQLASTDNQAYAPISSIQGTINAYRSSVDGIKQSSINIPEQITNL